MWQGAGVDAEVVIGEPRVVVPGRASSHVSNLGLSNNNLDVCVFGGSRFLAWRTAPTHFASSHAAIHIAVSSDDGASWEASGDVHLGVDVREPRFFEWSGVLFMFFCTLGTDWRRFEPGRVQMTQLRGSTWSAPVAVSETDAMAWRVRELDGIPVMAVYRAGSTIYSRTPRPTSVELWTTDDGEHWEPIDRRQPEFHRGGTETEIVRTPRDGLIAITRMEGPEKFGSEICRAHTLQSGIVESRIVPFKLDSPLLFTEGDEVFLIARRSLEFRGNFDLGITELPPPVAMRIYHRTYWATPKRTALWRVDARSLDVEWIADLPGQGDTCFPGLIRTEPGKFIVYNYTSPLDGADLPWLAGQHGPTHIYEVSLEIRDPRPTEEDKNDD